MMVSWMNRQSDGCNDGRVIKLMDGWAAGLTVGRTDRLSDGRNDSRTNGVIVRRMNRLQSDERMSSRMDGLTDGRTDS